MGNKEQRRCYYCGKIIRHKDSTYPFCDKKCEYADYECQRRAHEALYGDEEYLFGTEEDWDLYSEDWQAKQIMQVTIRTGVDVLFPTGAKHKIYFNNIPRVGENIVFDIPSSKGQRYKVVSITTHINDDFCGDTVTMVIEEVQ